MGHLRLTAEPGTIRSFQFGIQHHESLMFSRIDYILRVWPLDGRVHGNMDAEFHSPVVPMTLEPRLVQCTT